MNCWNWRLNRNNRIYIDYEVWYVLNNTEAIKRAVAADIGIACFSNGCPG
jgi:DNA-binding transcriptional LysR family regulator